MLASEGAGKDLQLWLLREQTPQVLREKTIHFLRGKDEQEQEGQTQDTLNRIGLP